MKQAGDVDGQKTTAKKTTKKRAGRKAGAKKATTASMSKALTAENLVQAKKLVDDLGGIEQARRRWRFWRSWGRALRRSD